MTEMLGALGIVRVANHCEAVLLQDEITLNDFPGRFISNALHAVGLTHSRCFIRLDLNQGRADLIGMYCRDMDNPGIAHE